MRYAWPRLKYVFGCVGRKRPLSDKLEGDSLPECEVDSARYSLKILEQHPVDFLAVEHLGVDITQQHDKTRWENLIRATTKTHRPTAIVEMWPEQAINWGSGPMGKLSRTRWEELGYSSRFRVLNATQIGGAIDQVRLVVIRVAQGHAGKWEWPAIEPSSFHSRPMSNLLTPPGLTRVWNGKGMGPKGRIYEPTEPMPSRPGSWIQTSTGVRRIGLEEYARAVGIPKELVPPTRDLKGRCLVETTSVFHWEYLSEALAKLQDSSEKLPSTMPTTPVSCTMTCPQGGPKATVAPPEFSYEMPDIREGGEWYRKRLDNLHTAASQFPNPSKVIEEGRQILVIHRGNYSDTGPDPKQLQLLWWEWPREHWEGIRTGSRMNFLAPPLPGIHPNAKMDAEQTQVARAFVEELVDLKVLRSTDEGMRTITTAPLFVVPKEGQPGQWRVIADMLRGGQNASVGADPVILPRTSHILDRMYTGGYSAVVDASKFFYQFPTHPDDRPYLGLVHPITGIHLQYHGLPMGAGNSPASASRYGLSFLRLLRENFSVFQGQARANCFWTGFHPTGLYDPVLGYGYVLVAADGPAVLLWVHVDDFLIHGPTYEKTALALKFFLDTAVTCGLLCHPKKLVPPRQVVKYCGFLLDSTSTPCLRIPIAKRERALAMVDFLLGTAPRRQFSRLALAVVAGVLQSLAEATPAKFGNTKLRRLHSVVHPCGYSSGATVYYTYTRLPPEVRRDLIWWREFLLLPSGRFARSARSATLVPNWGDGSGTGTGGTLGIPDRPLKMWKGTWSPVIYSFSSNYKELNTLRLTLLALMAEGRESVRGTTIFYFTDNTLTYWIAASGTTPHAPLLGLIEEIRLLELQLECSLQVVHVPGLTMIIQGTDGLSRGVWLSPFNSNNVANLTAHVFDPLPFDPLLVRNILCHLGLDLHSWRYQPWDAKWDAQPMFGNLNVWFPPPELARQALTFMLETWVEVPRTTSALFFVPRVVPSFWFGLSRFLQEVTIIKPSETTLRFPPVLPIPFVVIYLLPHVPLFPTPRLDMLTFSRFERAHRTQADAMRRLPPHHLQE